MLPTHRCPLACARAHPHTHTVCARWGTHGSTALAISTDSSTRCRAACAHASATKVGRDNCIRMIRSHDSVVSAVKNHLIASQMRAQPSEGIPATHPHCGPVVKSEPVATVAAKKEEKVKGKGKHAGATATAPQVPPP